MSSSIRSRGFSGHQPLEQITFLLGEFLGDRGMHVGQSVGVGRGHIFNPIRKCYDLHTVDAVSFLAHPLTTLIPNLFLQTAIDLVPYPRGNASSLPWRITHDRPICVSKRNTVPLITLKVEDPVPCC
jgi:hypothetical protein